MQRPIISNISDFFLFVISEVLYLISRRGAKGKILSETA